MRSTRSTVLAFACIVAWGHAEVMAEPVGTAFTYQGQLKQGGVPVNGTCDLEFSLWDAVAGPAQVGSTQARYNFSVHNGLITAKLDFGNVFDGNARWLQIAARCPAGSGTYTDLTPRQELTAGPYALFATKGGGGGGDGYWAANGSDIYNTNSGNIGVGTTSPLALHHVSGLPLLSSDLPLQSDDILIESNDAVLGLYSTPQGSAGSALTMKQIDAGMLVDTWALVRETTNGGAGVRFTYGSDDNYWNNPAHVYFDANGNVGIGTLSPDAKLEIGGTPGVDGIMFPDGTLQTTAVGGGAVWTRLGNDIVYNAGRVGIGASSFAATAEGTPRVAAATFPSPRFLECALSPATGKIYCFGGGDVTMLDEIVEYNPAADTLVIKSATLPSARWNFACAADPGTGKIYCFGGWGDARLDEIVEYDPSTDTVVTQTATLRTGRTGLSCAASSVTGKIYCFGGRLGEGWFDEISEYDPTNDTLVTQTATLPYGRDGLSCAESLATGKIYCFGSLIGNTEIVEYDPITDTLVIQTATQPPPGRSWLGCAESAATGKIYCLGGKTGRSGDDMDEIVEYDPATDTLVIEKARVPGGRSNWDCAPDPANGKIYCFGGRDRDGDLRDEIVEFTPPFDPLLQVGEPADGTGAIANAWGVFSSRQYKADIEALGASDYDGVLAKLKDTDVVRYRYRNDVRRTVHLGVIAEESPPEILGPGGNSVSLGDYAAFLLAAIKAQQREIEGKDRQLDNMAAGLDELQGLIEKTQERVATLERLLKESNDDWTGGER